MTSRRVLFIADAPGGLARGMVRKVARLAAGLDAEVKVFDCAFDPTLADAAEIRERVERRRVELTPIVRLLESSGVRARAVVHWAHPPREGVMREIRSYRPDLAVIVSRNPPRLARTLFTYSDYKLIETARCPILVMKNDLPYTARVITAVDPMHAHDKPAALDERIVDVGKMIAKALQLPLHLFHARSLLPHGLPRDIRLRDLPEAVLADVCGAWEAKAESRVRQLAQAAGVPEKHIHFTIGEPADLLRQLVARSPGDLLVMGAVARSKLKKALIGHTAEKVLDSTDCDVVVVKLQPAAARLSKALAAAG